MIDKIRCSAISERSKCHLDGVPTTVKICPPTRGTRSDRRAPNGPKKRYKTVQQPFQGPKGFRPSLYVACDYLARDGEAYLCSPAYPKSSDPMSPFQLGVRCFDPCADPVAIPPLRRLLKGVHMIPQAEPRGDLQTEVPDGITDLAALSTMVGSPYRAAIEHRARSAEAPVEDRIEGTAGPVVRA